MKQIRNLVPFGPKGAKPVNTGAGYEQGYKVVKPSGQSPKAFSRNDGKKGK